MNIDITMRDENDNEFIITLPAKHEVCNDCEGHGTHLAPGIRNHCYSMEEFEEEFPEPEDKAVYFARGGRYDVVCETCGGKNVVKVVDESALSNSQKGQYAEYIKLLEEEERESYYEESMRRAECGY